MNLRGDSCNEGALSSLSRRARPFPSRAFSVFAVLGAALVISSLVGCGTPGSVQTTVAQPTITPAATENVVTPEIGAIPSPAQMIASVTPALTLPVATVESTAGLGPLVQLTDNLGVEASVELWVTSCADAMLYTLAGIYQALPLKIAEGAHMLVPWRNFRAAYASGQGHVVTLATGEEIEGQLECVAEPTDLGGDSYHLSAVQTMVLVGLPELMGVEESEQGQELRQIEVSSPVHFAFSASEALFAFQYRTSEGYALGAGEKTTLSSSFYLLVNDERIPADLYDGDEFYFDEDDLVSVRAGGQETAGTLVLIATDEVGEHGGYNWRLVATSDDRGTYLVLEQPVGTLSKVSP